LWSLMNGLNSLRLWGRTQKAIKNCLNSWKHICTSFSVAAIIIVSLMTH
jgi:hypothetical protein